MRNVSILLFALSLSLWQCSAPKEKIPPVPEKMKSTGNKIVIYQMMTRLFGNIKTLNKPYGTLEENGCGKFEDIDDKALMGIKELGVSHIWYTGVIEHALLTDYTSHGIPLDDADVVKGRAGSPYAIKDYYDINPDLAVDVKNRMLEFGRKSVITQRVIPAWHLKWLTLQIVEIVVWIESFALIICFSQIFHFFWFYI